MGQSFGSPSGAPRCAATTDGNQCHEAASISTPVLLCQAHKLRVALDATPAALGYALERSAPPASRRPAVHEAAGPVLSAEPAAFVDGLASGRHEPIVYFLLNGSRVKIGFTHSLAARLRALALNDSAVILLLRGGRRLEKALHAEFAASRIKGTEWFEITVALLHYMGGRLVRPSVTIQPDSVRADAAENELPRAEATRPRMSEARQALLSLVKQAKAEGWDRIGPRHVWGKHRHTLRRSRPWVSAELARLADEGVLRRTDEIGLYTFCDDNLENS
ncbi:GIY-YIG nuclease family protein [Streptomyces bacillaris]